MLKTILSIAGKPGLYKLISQGKNMLIAVSYTHLTIIYKAFDDLGLRQQRFAGLVLSILILEDILAIVLMVMLSTMAVSQNFEGSEMQWHQSYLESQSNHHYSNHHFQHPAA